MKNASKRVNAAADVQTTISISIILGRDINLANNIVIHTVNIVNTTSRKIQSVFAFSGTREECLKFGITKYHRFSLGAPVSSVETVEY